MGKPWRQDHNPGLGVIIAGALPIVIVIGLAMGYFFFAGAM